MFPVIPIQDQREGLEVIHQCLSQLSSQMPENFYFTEIYEPGNSFYLNFTNIVSLTIGLGLGPKEENLINHKLNIFSSGSTVVIARRSSEPLLWNGLSGSVISGQKRYKYDLISTFDLSEPDSISSIQSFLKEHFRD